MPDEMTKAELEKIIKEKAKEEFQEQFKSYGKKDVNKMPGDEESAELRRLRQEKMTADIEKAMDKCIGDKCDMIAERVYAKIEKGQKVDIGDLKAEIAKANKTYEATQKKLEEVDAKITEAKKAAEGSSKRIDDFASEFLKISASEVTEHCENCNYEKKKPFIKDMGKCSNPAHKGAIFSNVDQANNFQHCPGCGAEITWKEKKE